MKIHYNRVKIIYSHINGVQSLDIPDSIAHHSFGIYSYVINKFF